MNRLFYTDTLSEEAKVFCEYWLYFWSAISKKLTSPTFTEASLRQLIVYEANTRQRKHVLKLLTGRYSKLRRQREWKELNDYMEVKDANQRKSYRSVSPYRGSKARRPRN